MMNIVGYNMYMKKILGTMLVVVMSLGLFSLSFTAVEALGGTPPLVDETISNPTKYDTFPTFVAAITKTAVEILMPFVVLGFIWSGFLFVKAQGNAEGLKNAKTAIFWSIIGAFILMGAYGFATIIGDTISTITKP